MPNYRRSRLGNTFFFTIVTFRRRALFDSADVRAILRTAMDKTRRDRPWETLGMVLLPDHLHVLWRLPDGDADYSTRIAVLKKRFTRAYLPGGHGEAPVPPGQRRHRRRGVWQRRFWEHTIRDARDFRLHLDYIHVNPVKHGLVKRPADWPWSTFHACVRRGWYQSNWCGRCDLPGAAEYFWPETDQEASGLEA